MSNSCSLGLKFGLSIQPYCVHSSRPLWAGLVFAPIMPLGFHQTEVISHQSLDTQRVFTAHVDWSAAMIHLLLRIFGVPISSNLYALHDARRITSRLTSSIGLKLECPHTPIHAPPCFSSFQIWFIAIRFQAASLNKTVLC
jgi:hypothetical protein